MAISPLRVGFVLRSFTYGGAEHDVIQIITRSDPAKLQFVGLVVQAVFPLSPDLPIDHPSVPFIYQPGAVPHHPKIVGKFTFSAAVAQIADQSDVLVTWGVADLDEALPRTFRGRVIVSSKHFPMRQQAGENNCRRSSPQPTRHRTFGEFRTGHGRWGRQGL